MADEENHINKNKFKVPFVCGCRDLGEALVRAFLWFCVFVSPVFLVRVCFVCVYVCPVGGLPSLHIHPWTTVITAPPTTKATDRLKPNPPPPPHHDIHNQRRIAEGAAMLRTKGEAGTGNVVEAVRHARAVQRDIRRLTTMDEDELYVFAKEMRVRFN